MLDGAVSARLVVVENEAGVVENFTVFASDENGGIEIELGAVSYARIPAQAHDDLGQTWCFFGQTDVAALLERNCHNVIP